MARKTPQERIADLERQHAQIKARLNRERAFKEQIWRILNTHVTRKQDRALLGLDAERVDQK